ncbi:MAG: hypothetical protein AVDCRST_MAG89-3419, partial [uncultured Gemmatimonadetes bacterium]
ARDRAAYRRALAFGPRRAPGGARLVPECRRRAPRRRLDDALAARQVDPRRDHRAPGAHVSRVHRRGDHRRGHEAEADALSPAHAEAAPAATHALPSQVPQGCPRPAGGAATHPQRIARRGPGAAAGAERAVRARGRGGARGGDAGPHASLLRPGGLEPRHAVLRAAHRASSRADREEGRKCV